MQTYYLKHEPTTFYTQPELQQRFTFKKQDWLDDLNEMELSYLAHCADLYSGGNTDSILELLQSSKKRRAIIKQIELLKMKMKNLSKQKVSVEAFFEPVILSAFFHDLLVLPHLLPYTVDGITSTMEFSKSTAEDLIPLDHSDIVNGNVIFEMNDKQFTVSIQALLYFSLINELLELKNNDRTKLLKGDLPVLYYFHSYTHPLVGGVRKPFFVDLDEKCIASFGRALIVYNKTIRFLTEHFADDEQSQLENAENFQEIKEHLQACYIDTLNLCFLTYQQRQFKKVQTAEQLQMRKVTDLQNKLDRSKAQLDKHTATIDQLKIDVKNKPAEVKITEVENPETLKKLQDLQKQKREYEKENRRLQTTLQELKEKNMKDLSDLRQENSQVKKQLVEAKRLAIQQTDISLDDWLKRGKELLQSTAPEEQQVIKNFIEQALETLQEREASRVKTGLSSNVIGHCLITDEGHFIRLADGTFEPITALPDDVYLSNDEFIEVTKDFEFARKLNYFFKPGMGDESIKHFVQIEQIHHDFFVKINGQSVSFETTKNFYPRAGQLIALTATHELVRYYLQKDITLDDYMPSVRVKGHQPYFVELALKNGYALRNILTGEQSFLPLTEHVNSGSMIIVKNDTDVTFIDYTGLHYKCSNYYMHKSLASVSEIDDDVFILKDNQEYVILTSKLPGYTPELGDVIWIDEHNAMIKISEEPTELFSSETIEQKLKNHPSIRVNSVAKKPTLIDKKLLVIGNVRLSERYKTHFAQLGFETETVDGFGPFEKIRMASTKVDAIIYSTAFTSHKNSGKVKMDLPKKVILCDSTSPHVISRLLEQQSYLQTS